MATWQQLNIEAWSKFIKTDLYKECIKAMEHKGLVQPGADNILKAAFDEGFGANLKNLIKEQ